MRSLGTALFLTRRNRDPFEPGIQGPGRKSLSGPPRGFTFIEILVALSLVGVLAGSLYATYASGVQIHKRAQKLELWTRAAFWSFDAITSDLENMLPYHSPGSSTGTPNDFFEGTSSSLKLLCSSENGIKEVRYFLKDPEYGTVHKVIVGKRSAAVHVPITVVQTGENRRVHMLVREEKPFPSADGDAEVALGEGLEILNRYVLKDGLKFFFAEGTRGASWDDVQWESAWKKPALPSMVRIEMTLVNPQAPDETVDLKKDIFVPLGAWQ